MSKKNKQKKQYSEEEEIGDARFYARGPVLDLRPETRKSILGIIFLAVGFIIVLSFFGLAGPFGIRLYKAINFLFGLGSFLLPLLFFAISFVFLASQRGYRLYFSSIFGAILFLACGLGIIEILYPKEGGAIGTLVSYIKAPFGFWAGLILLFSFVLVGILILFNTPLNLRAIWRKILFSRGYIGEKEESYAYREIEENLEQREKPAEDSFVHNAPLAVKQEKNDKDKSVGKDSRKKPITQSFYKLPPFDLLEGESGKPTTGDIKANANIIKRTLENFGIYVEMGEVNIGPTVTRYTLKPAEGMKLSRIVALQNDLSLSLAAHPIRIEAPIPGKSLAGIEVPNKSVTLVRVRNLINTDYFRNSLSLVFPVGRDVAGEPIYANLAKMPHLLIAGATGTGKSVCIHSIICSYLHKSSPEILNFILIDPKRVELTMYNGLPHLLAPVITEPRKAIVALKWATQEMDKRYDILLEENCRDISGLNQKRSAKQEALLPYIVIIIDELADLMAMFGREVEATIIRLAQMARATGIHLIVSTQRPSVEVITGLIKANITSRIAFQVASQVDSRTIIDMAGAEKLLGNGDMLFMSSDHSRPRRIQGVFVSEKEIKRVVDFIIDENVKDELTENEATADLTEALFKEQAALSDKVINRLNFSGLIDSDDKVVRNNTNNKINFNELEEEWRVEQNDELYPRAYEAVVEAQKASASYLQRRLRVGYARAARLLDLLEEKGIIGPQDGAKPRSVFVKPESLYKKDV